MKKVNRYLFVGLCMTVLLAGCSAGSGNDTGERNTSEESTDEKKEDGTGKSLVVYFSHSGNTKKIAEAISKKTNSDLFEITTAEEYSSNYDTVVELAQEEKNDQARPKLKSELSNLADYQTIYLGFPIWWGDMPMVLYSFLDEYDLSGKTIAPFCTHGGSGLSGTAKKIEREEPKATVHAGLEISDSSLDRSDSDIEQWVGNLK